MFKTIARAINQNKKRTILKLITVLSVCYIFTPYISHATPLQCSGDSTITPGRNDFIFDGTGASLQNALIATIQFNVTCAFIETQRAEDKIIFKFDTTQNMAHIRNNIYESGLPGIGLKFSISGHETNAYNGDDDCSFDKIKLEGSCKLPPQSYHRKNYQFTQTIRPAILDFKNSGIRKLTTPVFKLNYYLESDGPAKIKSVNDRTTGSVVVNIETQPTNCTLSTSDINFNLGTLQEKDFVGIGPKGNGQTQKISLTCNRKTKYSLQVDGDAEPVHKGVIKLTSESGAATGVGVQLLVNNNKIEINQANEIGKNVNHGTTLPDEIDITAQYYQTENRVTPGTANASATFTMTYQAQGYELQEVAQTFQKSGLLLEIGRAHV